MDGWRPATPVNWLLGYSMFAVLLWAAVPGRAWACTAPPEHLTVPYRELVGRTANIVLTRVDRILALPDHRARYDFTTVEVHKGWSDGTFSVEFPSWPGLRSRDTDFDRHRDGRFWDKSWSRQGNAADCQMAPTFVVGTRYLLFVDEPYHWKSFEKIESNDDRWLQAVRTSIRTGGQSGFSQTVWEYLTEKKAVYVDRIKRCLRDSTHDSPDLDRLERIRGATMPAPRFYLGGVGYSCRTGATFLTIHYEGDSEDDYASGPNVIPVQEGVVDFERTSTEIDLVGNKRVPLDEVRRRLR